MEREPHRLSGLYDEIEVEDLVAEKSRGRLLASLALLIIGFATPIVLILVAAFTLFVRHFGMHWGWALLPTFFVCTYTLSLSLMSAPIFFTRLPKLIRFRMRAIYGVSIASLLLILFSARLVLGWLTEVSILESLPWTLKCVLAMVIPLIGCVVFGAIFVSPRIEALRYQLSLIHISEPTRPY